MYEKKKPEKKKKRPDRYRCVLCGWSMRQRGALAGHFEERRFVRHLRAAHKISAAPPGLEGLDPIGPPGLIDVVTQRELDELIIQAATKAAFDTGLKPWEFQVRSMNEIRTVTGKLGYQLLMEDHHGNLLQESLIIGTNTDPEAINASTWVRSSTAARLKKLVRAAGIDVCEGLDDICTQLAGKVIDAKQLAPYPLRQITQRGRRP